MNPRVTVAASLSVLLIAGCASQKHETAEPAAPHEAAAPAHGHDKANVGRPAPAGSPLAKIAVGMSDTDVRSILGEPTNSKNYVTGKQFIPYYYGPDTSRMEYIYRGLGRVTFSRNRYSGGLKVIRVDYDPSL